MTTRHNQDERAPFERTMVACFPGCDPGLNIQQHVWLTLFAAHRASDLSVGSHQASMWADSDLPIVLKRLKELA